MKKTTKTPTPNVSRIFREFPVQAALRNIANPRGRFSICDRGTLLPSNQPKWLISIIDGRRRLGDECETLEFRGDLENLEVLIEDAEMRDCVEWRREITDTEIILTANP